jgi:hypothetical protein
LPTHEPIIGEGATIRAGLPVALRMKRAHEQPGQLEEGSAATAVAFPPILPAPFEIRSSVRGRCLLSIGEGFLTFACRHLEECPQSFSLEAVGVEL